MASNEETMRIVLKPGDAEIVRQIMTLTGVSTGSDAVGMLLKKCGNRFINWWDTGCLVPASPVQTQEVPILTPELSADSTPIDYSEPISW
ncbi:MAG TPA: hypothetical protein V6D48_01995 [Oculatellaceae cyanobacterium]